MVTKSAKKTAGKLAKTTKATTNFSLKASLKTKNKQPIKLVVTALVVLALTLTVFRYRYLLVPATVNNKPIFIWKYLSFLHKLSGKQVLSQLIVEDLIKQEVKTRGVTLEASVLNQEMSKLEEQFSQSGGLDSFLASQGVTRKDVEEQIRLNLLVEKMVAKDIEVTDAEVDENYSQNQDSYQDISEEEAKQEIREDLRQQKIQQQMGLFIDEIRAKANIKILLPGINGI